MVEYGTKVIEARKRFIEQVNDIISDIHYKLTGGKETLVLSYESSIGDMSFEEAVKKNRNRDIKFKSTSAGPHRDDVCFRTDGIDIRKFGSQGQQRTAALSLKLSEIELVRMGLHFLFGNAAEVFGQDFLCHLADKVLGAVDAHIVIL